MLLRWLTYVTVLIIAPDYAFLQTLESRHPVDFVPCEKGWYNLKEKCYKIIGKEEKASWVKAAEHCREEASNLVTIESKEENDFLVSLLLLETRGSAWIGLHDQVNESQYEWESGSKSEYRNWRDSEPSGFNRLTEDCAQLLVDLYHDSVGEWNDNDCGHEIAYICEKKSNPQYRSVNLLNCSYVEGGGFRFGNSCYHYVTEKKTWEEAEQHCIENYGGHLITILDKATDFYLMYLKDMQTEMWIGIKTRDQFQQKWTSGWYVGYDGFQEVYRDFENETCVIRAERKKWNIVSCSKKYPFVCEKSEARPQVLKSSTEESCCPRKPKGWRDLGGDFCYFIEKEKTLSWPSANLKCMQRGSTLVALHSKEESEILHSFIQNNHVAAHIGLFRSFWENQPGKAFKWTDGSQMDFQNWANGEPNSPNEECVEARSSDMTWNDISCAQARPYICSIRKITRNSTIQEQSNCQFEILATSSIPTEQSNGTTESSVETNSTAEQSDRVLIFDGGNSDNRLNKVAIGIAVCCTLLLVILVIVLYKYRPWILLRRNKLNPQMSNYKEMVDNEQGSLVT